MKQLILKSMLKSLPTTSSKTLPKYLCINIIKLSKSFFRGMISRTMKAGVHKLFRKDHLISIL